MMQFLAKAGLYVVVLFFIMANGATFATCAEYQKNDAASAFEADLFKSPLLENWRVKHYSWQVSEMEFRVLKKDSSELRLFLGTRLQGLAKDDKRFKQAACDSVSKKFLETPTYLDRYPTSFLGKYAFAIWFMKFDHDNWFSHERIIQPIDRYLSASEAELVLVKGVGKSVAPLFRTSGVFFHDLPVVLDSRTRTVTIITAELFD